MRDEEVHGLASEECAMFVDVLISASELMDAKLEAYFMVLHLWSLLVDGDGATYGDIETAVRDIGAHFIEKLIHDGTIIDMGDGRYTFTCIAEKERS